MTGTNRSAASLIEQAENYFRMVDSKDMEGLLAMLTADCTIAVESGGVVHSGRDGEIRTMFQRLFDRYDGIWHGDFHHVPSALEDSIASQFRVVNTDADGNKHHLSNCNFFWLKGDLYHRICIYMSGENTLT